jgi:anaerobic dimethyl sulfoxide reductase subunit B (iron-sulfur subunit)
VSGGGWQQRGAAWTNTVFAYNVSMSCNHCADPACAAACPTGAYVVRDDGLVWSESEKCTGCEYCAWACPYGAPQYSADLGRTTKCDFCRDLVDELLPACVAASDESADFVETENQNPRTQEPQSPRTLDLWRLPATEHPFPLPPTSGTKPHVAIKPHRAMGTEAPMAVANYEEVRPASDPWLPAPGPWHLEDLPLVGFTLLGQAAAGIAVLSLVTGLSTALAFTVGLLIGAATLLSTLHLGTASNAAPACQHDRESRNPALASSRPRGRRAAPRGAHRARE